MTLQFMPNKLRSLIPSTAGFLISAFTFTVAVIVYWSGLHGGFFFDDGTSILHAKAIHVDQWSLPTLRDVFLSAQAGPLGRPITQLSFALNYYFSELNPFYFKLTSLAIHLANSLLVYYLARNLLAAHTSNAKPCNKTVVAAFLTIAWLLHPIQLLAILHVAQRATSLSALFLLAALLMHISARSPGLSTNNCKLIVAWGVFWPLSMLSKEIGVLFPLFALAWELIPRKSTVGRLDHFAKAFTFLVALSWLAASIYAISPMGRWLWAGYEFRSFTLVERLLTEGRVLWTYLGLMFFPRLSAFGLQHDDLIVSTGLLTPWTTLPALVGIAGLMWLCWRLRSRAPLVAFGIAWFLIGHLLESTALPLEIAHEHRNYLPLFGILFIVANGLAKALNSHGPIKTLGASLAVVMLTFYLLITALRSHQFGDDIRRTDLEAQFHPKSARAQYEAGIKLVEFTDVSDPTMPSYSFARKYYERSGELDPSFKHGWVGLIHLNCTAGIHARPEWTSELERRLRGTPFAPGDQSLMHNLKEMAIAGTLCLSRKEVDGLFLAALGNPMVDPNVQSLLLSWYADYLWLREHDLVAAQAALSKSLNINQSNPSNRLKWAQLALLSGNPEQARELLIDLKESQLSAQERITRTELLTGLNITKP